MVIATGLFVSPIYSQDSGTSDDRMVRSVMAFDEDAHLFNFETPAGQAYSNLMVRAFTNMLPLPELDFSKLPDKDRSVLEDLRAEMLALRADPPTWEQIQQAEIKKVEMQTAPPTPPVFAGSEEAERYYRTIKYKNAVKHNPDLPGNYVEKLQDNGKTPEPIPVEPKKEETE